MAVSGLHNSNMALKKLDSKPTEWRSSNFKIGFISTIVCFVLFLIAFASPYWLQTYVTVPYDFKNMGLWEICFSDYYFRKDPFANRFDGCLWSFAIELDDGSRGFRQVFNPDFFVVVQVFSVAVLILLIGTLIGMAMVFLRCAGEHNWNYWIVSMVLTGLTSISGILLFIIIMMVGIMSGDRTWMPRADLVWLSWGYAAAVVATGFALLSAFFFGKEAKQFWGSKAPIDGGFNLPLFRQGDAGLEPPDSASVFTSNM